MLRVLIGSEDLKAVAVEESFNASNFRSHLFFLDDRGSLPLARSSTWQDTTSKLPVIHLEGEQTHQLMEKDERLSTHFTGMTSNDTTMQTLPQIGCPYCYPSCYSAFESGRTAAAAHGFHFRHEGQTHHDNKPQEMHFIKVEDGSQFEALAANADAPQTSIVDCDLYSSDAASDTYHQTDDINDLFAISETASSLIAEGTTPRRAPITILDACISQGSEPSPHEAEWTSAENVASSVSPRPWLEIPTPTADNILAAVSTSYSMIAAQEHHVSDSFSEGPGYDRSLWDTVNLSGEAQFYGEINSALAQLDAANIHLDPSIVENDGSNAAQSLLFPWASKRTDCPAMLSIGSGRAASQGCNDGSYQYHKSRYRLNEPWPLPNPSDIGPINQGKLLGRPLTCLRDKRNAFLIECKPRGLSYKDIKRIGGFKEAESTLRGRFRTLTKSKEQRVRKPQWHQNDIRLLCEAVNVLSEATDQEHGHYSFCWAQIDNQLPKVSWKRVAQYIRTHGGSYHFGNATCKKKWCEVHGVKI
ncbi:hypothetical protein CBS115989_10557 [Aspergillus niger]|uniref:Uncharacterized protein n=3 Tax=Aspergillus niger TaxID=5061 RepID=A2R8N8_ASPNC|nr:hypothetical protein An16g07810 [Aspergillus niger]RDH16259.1 hypothetical protein M747DRAFT_286960 [Aspergillus niger ATCC 13496]KAI2812325.1 hypothetical protein CBS115989_10557 [Aspergillus niger]KAI2840865.1 hypothetical protein CBS11232_8968 [Aspergillus niger]KAI2876721.1 hypothetical protein CBS115988_4494 [Aspergillus niger]CAK47031.1 hypothetical protein An16g07810 [Aspergillus niger]|eukprot:XP_001398080.1 hypothetical protein ANI_1_1994144 [Aspergillus niger CBS 513.88]